MKTILPLIAVLAALVLMAGNAQDEGRTYFNVNMASINEVGSGYDSDGEGTSVYNSDGTGFLRIELPVGAIANSVYTDDGMFYSLTGVAVEGITNYDSVVTTTTMDETETVVAGTGSTTGITLTLPSAATTTGKVYTFKKADAGAGTVIIDGAGAETIDGAATYTMTTQYESVTLVSDGADWMITAEIIRAP